MVELDLVYDIAGKSTMPNRLYKSNKVTLIFKVCTRMHASSTLFQNLGYDVQCPKIFTHFKC